MSSTVVHSRRRCAFTLVELLVVIGIIALLIPILLPALNAAQRHAKLTACLSNQRQIANAAFLYITDWKGMLPRDGMSGEGMGFTLPYLSEIMGGYPVNDMRDINTDLTTAMDYLRPIKLFKCPAVNEPDYVIHYAVNSLDFSQYQSTGREGELWKGAGSFCGQNVSKIKNPSECGLFFELNMRSLAPDKLGSFNVWNRGDMPFYIAPEANVGQPRQGGSRRMISADDKRHGGWTTIAFFDGHAEARKLTPEGMPITVLNPYYDPANH